MVLLQYIIFNIVLVATLSKIYPYPRSFLQNQTLMPTRRGVRTSFSPGTDLDNAYNVYGHEFSYNTSIGYGGLQDQLIISFEAGSTWSG
jgi:hypothetical protein